MPGLQKRRRMRRGAFKKSVRNVIRSVAEKKYIDYESTLQDLAAANNTQRRFLTTGPQNGVPSGTGAQQRIASKVMNLYANIRVTCRINQGTPPLFLTSYPTGTMVRLFYVWDTHPNATAPVGLEIWDTVGGGAQRNREYATRYHLLGDDMMMMSPGAMCPCMISRFIKINKLSEYKKGSTTATDDQIIEGALTVWMVAADNPVAGVPSNYSVTCNSRVVFQDI